MKRIISFLVLTIFILSSCKKKKEEIINKKTNSIEGVYVKDTLYKKGDVRRYGVYPNKSINTKNLNNVIELADKGIQINFPAGVYNVNLYLRGISEAFFFFDNVVFNQVNIIENDSVISDKIELKGKLTLLDRLFIRKSSNINFEKVLVKTDTALNNTHKKNRGVSIYGGSKNIHFNNLEINNTGGSNDAYFKYTAAALQIHGWNNNPDNVTIDELKISNVARSAVYLTGNNHSIKKVIITNYGLGSNQGMSGLDDAKKGDEKEFSGFWLNKCNSSNIDSLIISTQPKKGKYSLHLGMGVPANPTFISNIHFNKNAKKLPLKNNKLTNVLVENEY